MATPNKQPYYAEVFKGLVLSRPKDSGDRMVGMVAYAIFELKKDEHFKGLFDPDKTTQDRFLQNHGDEKAQNEYILQATKLLNEYGAIYAADIAEKYKGLTTEVKKAQVSYWATIGLGVVSSLLFTLLIGVGGIIFKSASPNTGFARVWDYVISGTPIPDTAPCPSKK